MSSDPLVDYLNLQHYNPLAIPRESFDPLLILGGSSPGDLQPLGALDDVLVAGAPLPPIVRDDSAAAFANRHGQAVGAKGGFNLLGGLLSALGAASARVSAAYSGAATFEYTYQNVRHDFVMPLKLTAAFAAQQIADGVLQSIAGFEYLYVVTDTLKSNAFAIAAYDAHGAAVNVDADALRTVLDVNAGFTLSTGAGSLTSYSGPACLRFAFRALRLRYDAAAKHVALSITSDLLVSKASSDPHLPLDAYEVLTPGEPVDLGAHAL